MAKLTLSDIQGQFGSTTEHNNNFALIETALENTVSRDGTTPNTMSADLDLNSQDINNVDTVNANAIIINGTSIVGGDTLTVPGASSVPNTPAGNIAATDVQDAINELDTEKVALAGTETITGDKTLSGTNTHSGVNTFSNNNIHSGDNTFSGANDHTGVDTFDSIITSEGASITAATDCDIWANADGNTVHLTGTTTVTDWGTAPQAGAVMRVICDAATPLTHNVTTNDLNLGGANYTCEAGDVLIVYAVSTSAYKVTVIPYDGESLIRKSGAMVQFVSFSENTSITGTTAIPIDNTIPQNTEGFEVMTVAITPKSTSNQLIIDISIGILDATTSSNPTIALFQDSTADALAVATVDTGTGGTMQGGVLRYVMPAGTTSLTTFKVRIGLTSGTLYFNRRTSAEVFGVTSRSHITITEVQS